MGVSSSECQTPGGGPHRQFARAPARDAYETEFGQNAQLLLDEASRRSDGAKLSEVVGRYFAVQRAGYKAAQ